MIIVDKKLPNSYNILFRGNIKDIPGTNIEKYYDDFQHVRVVPYSVVLQRLYRKDTAEEIFGRELLEYFNLNEDIDIDTFHEATGRSKTALYRRLAKMHWLINDIKQNGLKEPINGVINADLRHDIEYSLHVHPGTFRRNALRLLNRDMWVVLFDAYDLFFDYPKKSLMELFEYYEKIENVEISMIHHNTNLMTPQIINIDNDSRHSHMTKNIMAWGKKVKHMFDKPIKIFIGYDSSHGDASDICKKSILRKLDLSENIQIEYLDISKIEGWNREYKKQSTEFAYSRFLVPYLSNYEGVSIFCDDDFIFTENILNTILFLHPDQAVACVKHDFKKKYSTKFKNTKDVWYDKKLWSSLMVFNNSHPDCKKLTLDSVQKESGKYLHQFEWTSEDKIGSIPNKWNWCEGYSSLDEMHASCGLHWTRGGPWIQNMDCKHIAGLNIYDTYKHQDIENWKKAILDMSNYYDISWDEDIYMPEKICEEINK